MGISLRFRSFARRGLVVYGGGLLTLRDHGSYNIMILRLYSIGTSGPSTIRVHGPLRLGGLGLQLSSTALGTSSMLSFAYLA